MPTYAKILWYPKWGTYPVHYHQPKQYWQWPWENHRNDPGSHSKYAADSPVWVTPDSTRDKLFRYEPTEMEVEWYKACMSKKWAAPPISPEVAYNSLKLLGKMDVISEMKIWKGYSNKAKDYYSVSKIIARHNTDVLTAMLGLQHAITNNL